MRFAPGKTEGARLLRLLLLTAEDLFTEPSHRFRNASATKEKENDGQNNQQIENTKLGHDSCPTISPILRYGPHAMRYHALVLLVLGHKVVRERFVERAGNTNGHRHHLGLGWYGRNRGLGLTRQSGDMLPQLQAWCLLR